LKTGRGGAVGRTPRRCGPRLEAPYSCSQGKASVVVFRTVRQPLRLPRWITARSSTSASGALPAITAAQRERSTRSAPDRTRPRHVPQAHARDGVGGTRRVAGSVPREGLRDRDVPWSMRISRALSPSVWPTLTTRTVRGGTRCSIGATRSVAGAPSGFASGADGGKIFQVCFVRSPERNSQ